jgi:hypothetical protein
VLAIALPGIALIGFGAPNTQTSRKSIKEICGDPSLPSVRMLYGLALTLHEFAEKDSWADESCQSIVIELMLALCAVVKCCRTSIDAVRRQIVVHW